MKVGGTTTAVESIQTAGAMRNDMRIAHIITGLDVGGAESMLLQLIRASDRPGREHAVVTLTSANAIVPQFEALGVTVTCLNANGLGWVAALFKARGLIKAFRPDVVMTWMHHSDMFGVMLKATMPSLPLVWNIRCSKLSAAELPWRNLLIVRLLAWLSWLPNAIVTNSVAGQREHIAVGYRRGGWRLLPNGFDTTRFTPDREAGARVRNEAGISRHAFIVGLVARYHPMKGFDLFTRVAGRLARTDNRFHFVMVGGGVDGQNYELAQLIEANKLAGRVTLLGPRPDIAEVMNALDVIACTSTSEGFSNVIGEAMACGVPCVTTDVGDNALIVGSGGIIVPPGDDDALVLALAHMADLPEQSFRELKFEARKQILRNFAIRDIARQYKNFFDGIARN
jgi:glycosyltransferase involved in cell wall biosynthesis